MWVVSIISSLISHQPCLTPSSSLGYGVDEVVILVFGWCIGCWMCIFFPRIAVATALGWNYPEYSYKTSVSPLLPACLTL